MKRTLLAAALLAMAAPAFAVTATDTFDVKLKVTAACTITATDLDFGTHASNATANADATSTITVKCTKGTNYDVSLNAGTSAGATVTTRKMTGVANPDTVAYTLSNIASGGANWGASTVTGTGTGADQTHTVYGRVLAADLNVTADDYLDVVTATVTY